jgi:formate--tetrahydrofolate ligase
LKLQLRRNEADQEIAAGLGIQDNELEYYGHYKAKLSDELVARTADNPNGKLVLVTAINPTPAGRVKQQLTVGLGCTGTYW